MPDEITFKPRTAANRHVEDQATIDALRARVAELEGLLRRARSVIPNEYEDEIAVRTAINTYLNAHQGLGPGASYEPI